MAASSVSAIVVFVGFCKGRDSQCCVLSIGLGDDRVQECAGVCWCWPGISNRWTFLSAAISESCLTSMSMLMHKPV